MRYAVGLATVGETGDPRLLVDLGRQAEEAGWDGVFVWDHIAYRTRGWQATDPLVVLSALAAVTERVRLGAMVTPLARRRPWKVAREVAALDLLSGGRLVIGAGLGSNPEQEFAAFGEDPDARVRAEKLDEALEIVAGLLTGEPFSYGGRHHEVRDAVFLPRPAQRPRPPIWIAGRWPNRRPFERAARFDGVFPIAQGLAADQTTPVETLREALAHTTARRPDPGAPFDVVLEGITDPATAAATVAPYERAGLTWWIEKCGWFRGSVDDVRERIGAGPPR